MTDYVPLRPTIPRELNLDLDRQNPWWQGKPLPVIPEFRRWPYEKLRQRLDHPIAPIVVIRGPRQIGKTTLQLQLIQSLLDARVEPNRIMRVQFDELPALAHAGFDEPILRIVDWFESEVLHASINESARRHRPVFLFFDEIQNLSDWDVQLKSLVDHATVRVLVTGSSAPPNRKGPRQPRGANPIARSGAVTVDRDRGAREPRHAQALANRKWLGRVAAT